MKKFLNLKNVVAVTICFTLLFFLSCSKNSNGREDPIEYEPFVIEGMPTTNDLYEVTVLPNGTQINSIKDYAENIVNVEAACYVKQAGKTATYSGALQVYPAYGTLWTGSGAHVIVVNLSTTEHAFKVGDCTFSNGRGKVQYGSLKTIPIP